MSSNESRRSEQAADDETLVIVEPRVVGQALATYDAEESAASNSDLTTIAPHIESRGAIPPGARSGEVPVDVARIAQARPEAQPIWDFMSSYNGADKAF